MTAAHADQIITGYMKRLDAELAALPANRRRELAEEIADHIDQARHELADETDADLLTILDRVGEPAEIAGEARTRLGVEGVNPGPLEIVALLLIGVGAVVFPALPVAWVLGAALVWRSGAWGPRQKQFGVYLPLVVLLVFDLVFFLFAGAAVHVFFLLALPLLLLAVLAPLGSAVYMATRIGRRLPVLAWIAIVIVGLAVYVPAAASLLPARESAFIADRFPSQASAQATCGGFYATYEYAAGTPLAARAPVSMGICWDGQKVLKTWGPDCFPASGPALLVHNVSCRVETEPDGSMIVDIESSASATTAPFFTQSAGRGWRITPDGHIDQF